MLPVKATTGTWPTPNTLAYRKLVAASATKGRAASQFSTKWTPTILEKAAAALERTDFPEERFSGASHKKKRSEPRKVIRAQRRLADVWRVTLLSHSR